MANHDGPSESTVLRLSRYHCFLGELVGMRPGGRVRSRELAEELGLSEETVRHDLKYVDVSGRPGAGYDVESLFLALQAFLELSDAHPFAVVGSADVIRGLAVTFPAATFGMEAAAYLSERADDVGQTVDDFEIRPIAEAKQVLPPAGITEAIVACAPESVDSVLAELADAGVRGVLMLTPVLSPRHPDGVNVTYFRMPCALKSLAAARGGKDGATPSCCGS